MSERSLSHCISSNFIDGEKASDVHTSFRHAARLLSDRGGMFSLVETGGL
jgi:hypothetical protein